MPLLFAVLLVLTAGLCAVKMIQIAAQLNTRSYYIPQRRTMKRRLVIYFAVGLVAGIIAVSILSIAY